ncbi:MAG: hypothetical protein WEA04_04435 [Candidatus Andersenbacteria bacterium]
MLTWSGQLIKLQRGMSLLGVLIATFLLVGGSLAIVQLVSRTQNIVGIAQERFIAANLAREGLELVQAYRDTNWFSGEAWTKDICDEASSSDYQFTIDHDPVTTLFITANPSLAQQRLRITDTNLWTHHPSAATLTPYSRLISVDCTAQNSTPPLITISAKVTWQSRGLTREAEVKEVLYNWYKP